MSESHELYKKYKNAEQARQNAERRGSRYVNDYKQKERIAELEYKLKDIEEKESDERAYKLFSKYED